MEPSYTTTPSGAEESLESPISPRMMKLRIYKEGCFWFRRRRQPDWTDNYTLYRDKVQLNRLTQRQSVNIPLIKASIKTLLKDIDDAPILYFSDALNDDQQEVFYNEYWKKNATENELVLKDIQDKRNVLLFGRSFKFLNIVDGNFTWEVVMPEDVLVDRYVDPADIDTSRIIIREHEYVPLASIRKNPKYDTKAVRDLQKYMASSEGLIRATENGLDWIEKQRKMASMGVIDTYNPILGETFVELNEFFIKEWNEKNNRDEIFYVLTAEDMVVLYEAPLEEFLGKTSDDFWTNHYPCTTWGDEIERNDFWTDSVADSLRTLNKVLNAWFSQMVENRTLRNFGMNYFNSSLTEEGFTPQTFEPVPWGWYPIPVPDGMKIGEQIMRVDIPDLAQDGAMEEMNFVMTIAQQVSAATTFQQGVQQDGTPITLGEVKLLLANAQQRVKAMAVYYTASWEDFGLKFTKMLEAAGDMLDDVVIQKKGRMTKKNYAKKVSPSKWFQRMAPRIEVKMKQDQEQAIGDSLQKLQYAKSLMPINKALDTITKKKSLEFADLNASEMSEVIKEDEDQSKAMNQMNPGNLAPNTQSPLQGQPAMGALPPGNMQPSAMPPTPQTA